MFRKLVSNISFSPALVGQLSFYARRLRREEATRRLGLVFTALALVVQSFVVFTPPEPANAASDNDMVRGGIASKSEFLAAYDRDIKLRNVLDMAGVSRADLTKTQDTYLNNLQNGTGSNAWRSYGYHSRFSSAQGEIKHNANGTTVFSRPHHLYNSTSAQKKSGQSMRVLLGTSSKTGKKFAIQFNCGNLWTPGTPTPPPPPPPPPPAPLASCVSLTAIKLNDGVFRLKATASTANGATISKYTFNIRNASGSNVRTINTTSSSREVTTDTFELQPGAYTAQVVVATSLGNKTNSTKCQVSLTVPKPGVLITKKVNRQDLIKVELNEEFTYQIVVANTGQTTLTSLALSDEADQGVDFIEASQGTISQSRKWNYTIPTLGAGKSAEFTIKAKATKYASDDIKRLDNKVCVDTPSIVGAPDDCDNALVELPEEPVQVCDLRTDKLVNIKPSEFDRSLHSRNPEDCEKIQVCDLETSTVITIRKPQLDNSKHTLDLEDCEDIQVCELSSGNVIVIRRHQYDEEKHSADAADCVPMVSQHKKATNLSQGGRDATEVLARASDRIQYTLTVTNRGLVDATAKFEEHLDDVLEYAHLTDNGSGSFDQSSPTKTLSWPEVTLAPGESQSRIFTVQLESTVPAGARGISEASSYDCIMTNTFGNVVDVKVDCPIAKTVERTVSELPQTGSTENLVFAGVILSVATYFYARSRQLATEVRLIRRDLNTGTI